MTCRRALALFALSILVTLVALAYASPEDPAWVKGVYDDADYDDVVAFITSGAALAEPFAAARLRPVGTLVGYALHATETPVLDPPPSANPVRAPPAS
jgi:hypothetical protein